MAIGRTDERQNPLIPVAETCRPVVWMSLADPIWASGHGLASKAGHMTAFEPWPMSRKPLDPYEPSTHGITSATISTRGEHRFAVPRSTRRRQSRNRLRREVL